MRRWLLGFVMLAACGGTEADAVEQPPVQIGSPPDDCTALVGSEPWITLFDRKPTRRCVIVGEHQDVQIWNKGFDGLTIQWVTGQRRLGPDDHLNTGPSASVFAPGPNQIASSPYPMPIIWLLPEAASPSANIHLDGESFGPVSPGMSLNQASDALGLPIEIDPNLLPGPRCLAAVIIGDPYSPIFVVIGKSDPALSQIARIDYNLGEPSCP